MPGARRVQGRSAGSACMGPGALAISTAWAMGSKSARKCTELLTTRMARSSGSMPPRRMRLRSRVWDLLLLTMTRTPRWRRQTVGPRSAAMPCIMGPS
ncbi:Uncharacterised protein [Bordetella pertussis]|nr:Uncharacterised protein [Bordetella pertussis]